MLSSRRLRRMSGRRTSARRQTARRPSARRPSARRQSVDVKTRTPDTADESAIPGDRFSGESVVSARFGRPRVFRHAPESLLSSHVTRPASWGAPNGLSYRELSVAASYLATGLASLRTLRRASSRKASLSRTTSSVEQAAQPLTSDNIINPSRDVVKHLVCRRKSFCPNILQIRRQTS